MLIKINGTIIDTTKICVISPLIESEKVSFVGGYGINPHCMSFMISLVNKEVIAVRCGVKVKDLHNITDEEVASFKPLKSKFKEGYIQLLNRWHGSRFSIPEIKFG